MTISQEQFTKRLTDSGLMSLAEIQAFRAKEQESLAAGPEPDSLAGALVDAGRLTAFQAETLLAQAERPLRLGNYLLVDTVGAGGMGQVYKAVHERMHRTVALKVLPARAAMDPGLVARFRREVQVAAKLHHPNIVTAYDADEAMGLQFLVMELVDGRDLSHVVGDGGPLPIDTALDYVQQTATGLAYAHSQGVLHRDIKPSNLLVDGEGTVKILDMGLARLESSQELTSTGEVIGSAHTMAPEQGDDIRHVDERSDIYALGCTLYYLVAGRHVYEGDSALRVLIAHAQNPIPKLREACPDASADVEALYQGMVQKSKEDRYPSMAAVIEAVTALRGGQTPRTPAPPKRGRSFTPWLIGAGVLLLGIAALIWALKGGSDDTPAVQIPKVSVRYHSMVASQTGSIRALAMHPNGDLLLAGTKDGVIAVWDLDKDKRLHVLEGHTDAVRDVAISPDGSTAYSCSDDTTIRVWDLTTRETLQVLTGHQEKVRQISLSADGTWLASASKDGTLRIWDLPSGKERLFRQGHGLGEDDSRGLLSVSIRPDGGAIATTGFDRKVCIWDTTDFEVQTTLGPHSSDVGIAAFSPDSQYLLYDLDNGRVRVMNGDGTSEVTELRDHTEWVYSLAVSPDGMLAATGSQDLTAKLWHLPTGTLISTLSGHSDVVGALAFTTNGYFLATGSADDTIRYWEIFVEDD